MQLIEIFFTACSDYLEAAEKEGLFMIREIMAAGEINATREIKVVEACSWSVGEIRVVRSRRRGQGDQGIEIKAARAGRLGGGGSFVVGERGQ